MSHTQRNYKRRGREAWRQLIAEQQQSGLSQQAFCQEKGLVVTTFHHWKRRLAESQPVSPSNEADWLELPPPMDQATGVNWDIELDLGNGLCLRLRQR